MKRILLRFFSQTRFSLGKMLNKNKDRLDMSVDNSLLIIQGHLLNISSYLELLQVFKLKAMDDKMSKM